MGTKEDAQRYEIKMTAATEGDTTVKALRKVYSTDMSKEDVLKDRSSILENSKSMAERMAIMKDGKLITTYFANEIVI